MNNLRKKRALWILHKNVDLPVWLDVYVHFIQLTSSVEVEKVKMYLLFTFLANLHDS